MHAYMIMNYQYYDMQYLTRACFALLTKSTVTSYTFRIITVDPFDRLLLAILSHCDLGLYVDPNHCKVSSD